MSDHAADLDLVMEHVTAYPDFPKKGVLFRDIFGVYKNFEAMQALHRLLRSKAGELKGQIDYVIGLDSRGFLFGPQMAEAAGVPFVPVRKAGKLPGQLTRATYSLEYGEDSVELQRDAIRADSRVLIVDDLLATGGTMAAACQLVHHLDKQVKVVECFVVLELAGLNGRAKVKASVSSLIQY